MKSVLIIILFFCSLSFSSTIKGGPGPFPWGEEVAFPWDIIEGNWKSRIDGSFFYFEVISKRNDLMNLTKIIHYDYSVKGNRVVKASGSCLARADIKIIHCLLSRKNKSYWVLLRAYEDEKNQSYQGDHRAVILTIRDTSGDDENDVHHWLDKMSSQNVTF